MASAFQGFLRGAATQGIIINKENRERDALIQRSQLEFDTNSKLVTQKAEEERKTKAAEIELEAARQQKLLDSITGATAEQPSPLQAGMGGSSPLSVINDTGEEEVVFTPKEGSPLPMVTTTSASPAAPTRQELLDYTRLAGGDVAKGMTQWRIDQRAKQTAEASAARQERTFTAAAERQEASAKTAEEKAIKDSRRKEWTDLRTNKDSKLKVSIDSAIDAANTGEAILDEAEAANKRLDVGQVDVRRIPGFSISNDASLLNMANLEGALAKVQETVGAISNAEMELFGKASIGPSNSRKVNQGLINRARAQQLRATQFAEFMLEAEKTLSPQEAQLKWSQYINKKENQVLALNKKTGIVELVKPLKELKEDKSYLDALNPETKGSKKTSAAPTTAPSDTPAGNAFDVFLEEEAKKKK
jgi:hypothetical protein